jgi:hypothetical protein
MVRTRTDINAALHQPLNCVKVDLGGVRNRWKR